MNYLQYTSKEMVSATQLIRKSKSVFNSVSSGEIDKAVILRDGKPSFILLDFEKYELLMNEYVKMKEEKREQIEKKEVKKIDNTLKKDSKVTNKVEIVKENSIINNEENENLEEYKNNEEYEDSDILKDFWK
ncbi:MAG: hypothetical protein HRT40_00420 [Campylobacteraceae bacterium]|nr:hypothetical protein [Campylobacteraceae bacterium]